MSTSKGSQKRKMKAPMEFPQIFRDKTHEGNFSKFASKKCMPGRCVDFDFLRKNFRELHDNLIFQGLRTLLSLKDDYYPNLMHVVYSGINFDKDSFEISTYIKGKEICITRSSLGSIINMPEDGEVIMDGGYATRVSNYSRAEALSLMCTKIHGFENVKIKTSDLKLEMRVLHLILVHSIYPKSGSYTEVASFELKLMWMIMRRRKICFPTLILSKMFSVANTGKGVLPYGMLISRIFQHYDISVEEDIKIGLSPSDFLDERTMSRMGYALKDGRWTAKNEGKHTAASQSSPIEEDMPISMDYDFGASTSTSHATLDDIMHEIKDMRSCFTTRMGSIEEQMQGFRISLDEIRRKLHSDSDSDEC